MTAFDFSEYSPTLDEETVEESTEFIDDFNTEDPDKATGLLKEKKRSRKAQEYEKKIASPFRTAFIATYQADATKADAAAILMHAPAIAEKVGDLAAEEPRVARAVDWLTEGTENPYFALAFATAPLVMQILRNHEPQLVPEQRGIKIPFTKIRFKLKLGIRLGRLRRVTIEPEEYKAKVFNNPKIDEALRKLGIETS